MSLDITLLRLLKVREKYTRLIKAVPIGALDQTVAIILQDYGAFFEEFPSVPVIKSAPFLTWFKGFRHRNLKPEACAVFEQVLKGIDADVPTETEAGILERLVAADAANRITNLLTKWNDGEEVNLYEELRKNVEDYEQAIERKVKNPQVLDAIEELLEAEKNDSGLHWRLNKLNRHIKPLVSGDFVVIAARPDKGKTTFAADQLTFMAPQVDALYPGENRSILWFNNEGPGKRIIVRNFQAALGCTMEKLVELSGQPASPGMEKYKSRIREEYAKALGGRPGVLRVFDIHDMWNHEVEDIIRAHKPALVLFDMIDNIKFGGSVSNNGQRTDQLLEAMYQWARLMGVKHDTAVMAMSQISADGDGLQFPTLPMLKDSKTGKQGAADVIITIGTVNDPVLANSRYIGTTKNKKVRTGMPSSPMCEVQFCGDIARYVETEA